MLTPARMKTLTSHGSAQMHSLQPKMSSAKPLTLQSLPAQSTSAQLVAGVVDALDGRGDGLRGGASVDGTDSPLRLV